MGLENNALDPAENLKIILDEIRERLTQLENNQGFKWTIKEVTGAPTGTGYSGWFVENTVDTTLHAWIDGAWRQIYP